jgi:hypothetical protein
LPSNGERQRKNAELGNPNTAKLFNFAPQIHNLSICGELVSVSALSVINVEAELFLEGKVFWTLVFCDYCLKFSVGWKYNLCFCTFFCKWFNCSEMVVKVSHSFSKIRPFSICPNGQIKM